MSKHIEQIPLTRIARLQFWPNNGRRTLAQVMELTGADIGVNGTLYNPDWSPCGHVKADGVVLGAAPWTCWGYAWDSGCGLRMERLPCGEKNYITGTELLSPGVGAGDKLVYPAALGGSRGRTALGLTGSALVLYCCADGADGATLEEVRAELLALGCETALALDGGQSAKYRGGGVVIENPARPVVQNYILLWLTPETGGKPGEEHIMKHKVCLDPGHGPGTVNGSPDGSYKEREFAWDMYTRLRPLLEEHGVEVIATRREDAKPELTERAGVSNANGAEIFVSLHSNAAGGSGWSTPHGLLIYTSTPGESAGRNKLARAVLSRMAETGVKLSGGGLLHEGYTVLTKTIAPAVLIEYGFHTNREDVVLLKTAAYQEKLAVATAKGILDYLGVAWKDEKPRDSLADAVDKLAEHGVIGSPEYWKGGSYSAENVKALIIKCAAMI